MPGPWSVTRIAMPRGAFRRDRDDAADRAVRQRVGDDVAQSTRQVTRIRPRDRSRRDADLEPRRTLATHAVEGERDVPDHRRDIDGPRPGLERCRLGAREVVDVGHDAGQRGRRGSRRLEPRDIGRDDPVDHRLELRFEDRGGRREIVRDVARGPAAEHLRALEPIGHRVERLGKLARLAIGAPGRAGARLARLEPACRDRDVVERSGQPSGDPCRDKDDPEHAYQARHGERHVEEREEAAIAGTRREIGLERGEDIPVRFDRRVVVGSVAGRRPPERGKGRPVRADDADFSTERGRETRHEGLRASEPGRSRQAVGQGERGIIEALLLLIREDRLVARAHDPVHDGPHEQQQRDDRHAKEQAETPCQGVACRGGRDGGRRAHPPSRAAIRRYPVWGIVSMSHGRVASSPNLRRRLATWTSMTRS